MIEKPSAGKLSVALVRGPIVSSLRAFNNEATPSISLGYLSAVVREAGHLCTVVDGIGGGLNRVWPLPKYPGFQCQGMRFEEIAKAIPADVDVIGFSVMFSGEWPVQRDLIAYIRDCFPKALIVAGGEHATALSEYSLRDCPAIDVIVRGEGEATFVALLDAVAEKRDFVGVGALAYLDADGKFIIDPGLPRIRDVDTLPWPYWPDGYLEAFWKAGKSYGVQTERDMPMMLSRGCPYRCTFCSNPNMWTTRYILRDVENVVSEIKAYIERYQITAVQLFDLTAITKRRWAIDFLNRLVEEGININWSLPSGTRSEALDDEVLGLLKKTGCNYLVYAPESGSPRVLERIKKRIDLGKVVESVLCAKKNGLVIRTNLIIGFPGETRRDVMQTVWFGLKLAARGADEVSINIYSPYPGTELFDELAAAGKIDLGDDYFFGLTSLNSDYTANNPMTVNEFMGSRELAIYRLGFMLTNYALGYLIYPKRIVRTLRNVFSAGSATTVLEHRLKDAFKRRRDASGA